MLALVIGAGAPGSAVAVPGPLETRFAETAMALNARIYGHWFLLADTEYHLYLTAISDVDDATKDNATQELSLDFQRGRIASAGVAADINGLEPDHCAPNRHAVCVALVDRLRRARASLESKLDLVAKLIDAPRANTNYEAAARFSLAAANDLLNADALSHPAEMDALGRASAPAAFMEVTRSQLALRIELTKLFTLAPILSCEFARPALDGMDQTFATMDAHLDTARERWVAMDARGPYRAGGVDITDDAYALSDLGGALLTGMRNVGRTVRFWRAKLRESYGPDCRYNGFADFRAFNSEMGAQNDDLRALSAQFLAEAASFDARLRALRERARR